MSRTCLFTISTLSLSAVFLLLGLLFVARPDLGAEIYGVQGHDPATIVYLRAVGCRDLALAAYLFCSDWRRRDRSVRSRSSLPPRSSSRWVTSPSFIGRGRDNRSIICCMARACSALPLWHCGAMEFHVGDRPDPRRDKQN
ncbi:hypothetical protein N4G62_12700 [Sphingomonas sanguinis]|uniref:Uncharacterized protein n=1 Tax=Sphingomonas sanguinis TaxID=33051 RepID=A0ABU5LSH7_9SPHN|nr:hypothetical protein [Sphingomonas sanguinis]MDZ7282888.1 hypothetical protein [Sphingomonas sanguinis]